MPALRTAGAAACIDDRYLVYCTGTLGGSGLANTFVGEIDPWDPSIIVWREGAPYPAGGTYLVGYATIDDALFMTGGWNSTQTGQLQATLIYNVEHDAWLSLANKTTAVVNVPSAKAPYGIYFPGGYNGSYTNVFELYTQNPTRPVSRVARSRNRCRPSWHLG